MANLQNMYIPLSLCLQISSKCKNIYIYILQHTPYERHFLFIPDYILNLKNMGSIWAAPYLKRLIAGSPPRRPGFAPGSKWNLWWTKWRRGRFYPSTSVSPAKNRFIPPSSPSSPSPGAVSRGLATNWSLVQGVQLTVLDLVAEIKRKVLWRRPRPKMWL
jgi:hypothetical protein